MHVGNREFSNQEKTHLREVVRRVWFHVHHKVCPGHFAAYVRKAAELRSIISLRGFSIGARDWIIRYLVVDTRNWLPGRSVLISPEWVRNISWEEQEVWMDVARQTIENSPPCDPSAPVNREYEVQMYDYHGRPKYWA